MIMIGHNVTAYLVDPEQAVSGVLHQQNAEGIWLYYGWANAAAMHFFPIHRVKEIRDEGRVNR